MLIFCNVKTEIKEWNKLAPRVCDEMCFPLTCNNVSIDPVVGSCVIRTLNSGKQGKVR